ncbi:MAG: hypothetical protein IJY24_01110 [Clostridia bacterium]|nr:hypothetical protein [Clostridia bacterium]
MYVEGGKVHIKTSAAEQICLCSDMRWTSVKRREGRYLTEAEFSLDEWLKYAKDAPEGHNCWIRLEVIDKQGRRALTRAYFIEEVIKGM